MSQAVIHGDTVAATVCRFLVAPGLIAWATMAWSNPVRCVGALGTFICRAALFVAPLNCAGPLARVEAVRSAALDGDMAQRIVREARVTKHIGIVACSAEGAALCYRTLCNEAQVLMGEHMHPEVSMHTHPLGEYMIHIRSGNWPEVARLMLSSARKVAMAGAQFVICPDNTIHEAFDLVAETSPIPWLHIAEAVGQEAKSRGFNTLAITGTKYLMTGPVYPAALRRFGIACRIPNEPERERIDSIIFSELVKSVFTGPSRRYFNTVIQSMKDQGCDGVVLGCTEIPLLVDPNDCPLPTLDSTRLLARAALTEALNGD